MMTQGVDGAIVLEEGGSFVAILDELVSEGK